MRWAIRDLDKFNKLVVDLGSRITKLDQLLTETQQRRVLEDHYRINMIVIGSVVDETSLNLIRDAVDDKPATSQLRSALERRALSSDVSSPRRPKLLAAMTQALPQWQLRDFVLPDHFARRDRFITAKKGPASTEAGPGGAETEYFLFERKSFDQNVDNAASVTSRIQQLVILLHKPKSPGFRTPAAEQCIHDPGNSCWWIVFRFPVGRDTLLPMLLPSLLPSQMPPESSASSLLPMSTLPGSHGEPVSLLSLLQPTAMFRPPMEQRLALAGALCATFSDLYMSGWLHKGVRSENILFSRAAAVPPVLCGADDMWYILSSFLVCGFEYSRHESHPTDRVNQKGVSEEGGSRRTDGAKAPGGLSDGVLRAIYRHPNYQGEAAAGYRLQYDIYSVGLVLVEVALWMPLSSFLLAQPAGSRGGRSGAGNGGTGKNVGAAHLRQELASRADSRAEAITLSGDMREFLSEHAEELKRRVLGRVESELAFRVGTPYYHAVKFCLELPDRSELQGDVEDVHPAMEFFNNVVVPLSAFVEMAA